MKKKLLCVVLMALLMSLSACNSQDKQENATDINVSGQIKDSTDKSVQTQTKDANDIKEETTKEPKKKFVFKSADEVENISDEDLIYILNHDYVADDFFEEGDYNQLDLFDVEMQVPTEEWPNANVEKIWIDMLDSDVLGGVSDLNQPISSEVMKEYVPKDISNFFALQNTKEPDEETGSLVLDEEIILCGETDSYVEYSARYLEERSMYSNNALETWCIPRAYRKVYLKTIFQQRKGEYWEFLLLGDLSPDYVKEQMDLYLTDEYGLTLYREVSEEEDCYLYTRYYTYMVYGDFDVDDEVCLCKVIRKIDKETHKIGYESEREIKTVTIEGSATPD